MHPIYRAAEIRQIEHNFIAVNPGISLMERAGLAAAEKARDMLGDGFRALVVCGPGNNGGDGLVVARYLHQWGYQVTTVLLGDASKLPSDAAAAYKQFVNAGRTATSDIPKERQWDLIVDGLFGIGLARAAEGKLAETIEWVNATNCSVLALDIPSGLNSDTGNIFGVAIRATETITFIGLKPGLLTADGKDHAGHVSIASLNIDQQQLTKPSGHLLEQAVVAKYLPRRKLNSHKGSFGSLGIIGGADGMLGAVALASRAALKLGTGRVYLGTLTKLPNGYDPVQPELMWREAETLFTYDHLTALVIGPGMGQSEVAKNLLVRAIESPLPLLLDADALNLISVNKSLQETLRARFHPTLLTPHPTEAARLLNCDTTTIQKDRVEAALKLAKQFNSAVVLKGAGSICALPDGNWFINPTGNPGMASAGTGDVLSGLIGALLAQGLEAAQALLLGVYLHGAAADSLLAQNIGPIGMTASEIIDEARRLSNVWN
ncbi:MAG: NAD(P)H-hydrate dehydratase [Pseudomonadota bacterium]